MILNGNLNYIKISSFENGVKKKRVGKYRIRIFLF